jgi:hypothetical protein
MLSGTTGLYGDRFAMPSDRARLETALRQLQEELHALAEIDPQVRERLERTIEEIHAELEGAAVESPVEEHSTPVNASLADRLTETARNFEDTHPNLAGMVGSVIDALARMGI